MAPNLNNPKAVADAAVKIYSRVYQEKFEKEHIGMYAAINVLDGSATLGENPLATLTEARKAHPDGFFHLIRIGFPGTFDVGVSYRHVNPDRIH